MAELSETERRLIELEQQMANVRAGRADNISLDPNGMLQLSAENQRIGNKIDLDTPFGTRQIIADLV